MAAVLRQRFRLILLILCTFLVISAPIYIITTIVHTLRKFDLWRMTTTSRVPIVNIIFTFSKAISWRVLTVINVSRLLRTNIAIFQIMHLSLPAVNYMNLCYIFLHVIWNIIIVKWSNKCWGFWQCHHWFESTECIFVHWKPPATLWGHKWRKMKGLRVQLKREDILISFTETIYQKYSS